ncbi:RNA-directed DNA polymerase [Gordonia desulfuricans]|uniref:RNA-directed DNA polymerase n=1 Tax=Gordonia desulfuricans TaxID=89051 RepID=A0A7K3LS39_9ACTN|nr:MULTISPECIES: reverse transcriptase family protein [Gordonia]KOY50078.1 DNA polymerase [Gordonia sp. NB41Y]NDK91050.1 RNA-directed DNA polymerase [Gordonia desulfuricans]WLP90742.1 reverse transcriptase family protein [Gordonia sp. NB41Y]
MSEPSLPAGEVAAAAAEFSRILTAWTRSEIVRAVIAVLPYDVAAEAGNRLFERTPHEPRHPAAAFVAALQPWTLPTPVTRTWDLTEPVRADGLPAGLPDLHDVEQFAYWLDFTVPELEWFADRGGWLRTARPPLRHYRIWRRAKRDGVRVIEAPKPRMRETQRRLLRRLVERIPAHPAARGFVPGGSTAAFAWPHTDRPSVLRVDLRHCFETVTTARVRRVFADVGYPPAIARLLAEICTTATPVDELTDIDHTHASLLRYRHLPQGAPTSPHLANLVMRSLDRRLDGYARHNGLRYTRYGDDLALSGDDFDADRALWVVLQVVGDEGFLVHPGKVRIMHRHQQQRLAGLVVNDRPQVARADYDNLRALLHNAIRDGAQAQNRDAHPDFRAHVYGLIAWIGSTGTLRRDRLLEMAARVDWDS